MQFDIIDQHKRPYLLFNFTRKKDETCGEPGNIPVQSRSLLMQVFSFLNSSDKGNYLSQKHGQNYPDYYPDKALLASSINCVLCCFHFGFQSSQYDLNHSQMLGKHLQA